MQAPGHALSGSRWYLWRCGGCGLMYVNPRPARQIFGGFVPDAERDLAGRGHWLNRLRMIERLHAPGRLLDVGCGAGGFLRVAREEGWQVEGLDVQEGFARDVRARLGVPVRCGELSDPEVQTQVFDVVTLWDVIEHVPSVNDTLARAASILSPGGVIGLSTINAASFNARIFGPHWVFWNRPGAVPEHLQGFSPQGLAQALRRAGFRPVRSRTRFSAGAIIEPLGRAAGLDRRLPGWSVFRRSPPGRAMAHALWHGLEWTGRPLDLWGLGDILEVYAVRVDEA